MANELITIGSYTLDENDSVSAVIDSILAAPGLKKAYQQDKSVDWIMHIGNKNMETGIKELPPVEQEILKLYFLDGKTLIDIASDLDMPIELLCGHIKAMRVRLILYV